MVILLLLVTGGSLPRPAWAVDGGTLRVTPANGWLAFEVISQGDNPSGDGFNYSMPGTFDGAGAWMADASTLRVLVNHEETDAAISEVNLDLAALESAIARMISVGNTEGVRFVNSARQAYSRWSADGGATFTNTSSMANTSFGALCSGQAYAPNTFGPDRGFVDEIYITGEEWAGFMRLFALDNVNRDLYQLSGQAGSAPGGIGGIPFDAFENAALIDTEEISHVALMLSPDGGTETLMIYIGEKGKDVDGTVSSSFLARNGLAYGSWYYFIGGYPALGATNGGGFSVSSAGALSNDKLEDIDTSPSNPTRVVLGDQTSGVFSFDLTLDFSSGSFDAGASSFTITKISNTSGGDNSLNAPDNLDWTAATTLGATAYPEGLIFVNEDNSSGEIWQMDIDGSNKVKIGNTTVGAESTGIFDLSEFVGFVPGSILISNNQGGPSSMTVMINPDATSSTPDPVISGIILDGLAPVAGVTLTADSGGGSDTSDASGAYSVAVPPDWSGTITPALADYDFTPPSRSYTNVVADTGGENYAASFNPDLTAPTPTPLAFASSPVALSHSSISMTAQAATDSRLPVEYFFECMNDPSVSSGWQTSPSYTPTGLSQQTLYTFRVSARDGAGNEGAASASASATTDARPPEVEVLGSWQDGEVTGYSHIAPAGTDRMLVVLCHAEANAPPTDFDSVTYGGQALTQVVEQLQNQTNSFASTSEIWVLDEAGIAAATNSNLVATTTGAAETRRISSVFYEGVDQADPIGQVGTAGENANETQTLTVTLSGGELDAGDMVVANNTVRNDQNGNTSWTWQNGFAEIGSYNPAGAPYLAYSDAQTLADGTTETATVVIANNGVGALSVMALNHAAAQVTVCGDGTLGAGEQCDDGGTLPGDCCSETCQFESSATVCRASIAVCDLAETCDGAGSCAPNGFAPPSTLCRAASDTCDVAESCSGVSAFCSADAFQSAATECRPSAGTCDIAENCSGSGANCPSDEFESAGTECRPRAGTCDAAETCSGAGANCPADAFEPAGVECRSSAGVCDVAETCSGTEIECATDVVLDGTPCLDGDVCNGAEQCVAGVCEVPSGLDCDDDDECTADACDAITGCSHAPIPDCVAAVPSMPWAGRMLLALFMILASATALSLRSARQGA